MEQGVMAALTERRKASGFLEHVIHQMRVADPETPTNYDYSKREGLISTGFRYVTKEETTPTGERTGKWDPTTGRIVYGDGGETFTSVIGMPAQLVARRTEPEDKPQGNGEVDLVTIQETTKRVRTRRPGTGRKGGQKPFDPTGDRRRLQVIDLHRQGKTLDEIAKAVRMRRQNVSLLLRSPGDQGEPAPVTSLYRNGNPKLTPEDAIAIFLSEQKSPELAEEYGITEEAVRQIWSRRTWGKFTAGLSRDRKTEPNKFGPVSEERKEQAVALYRTGKRIKDIAKELHMHCGSVCKALDAAGIKRKVGGKPGVVTASHNGNARLTNEQAAAVKASGETSVALAKRFGVSASTIRKVRTGRTYKDVAAAD